VLGARWDEINWTDRTWTIPADRMKARQEHRVPLSAPALDLLRALPRDGELIFGRPGHPDRKLHHAEPVKVLRRLGHDGITAHGFRSSFRDWAADRTSFAADVAEAALAHKIGDKVRRAYERGDKFDQRQRLMQQWATFCTTPRVESGEVVIPL